MAVIQPDESEAFVNIGGLIGISLPEARSADRERGARAERETIHLPGKKWLRRLLRGSDHPVRRLRC